MPSRRLRTFHRLPSGGLRTAIYKTASRRTHLIQSFNVVTDHRPEVLYSIGTYYEMIGNRANSMRHYKLLADRPDFVDEFYKIDACLKLGRDLLAGGSTRLGRNYISKSATYGRDAGFGQKYMNNLVLGTC